MLESEYFLVLFREVFQVIPFARFEVLEPLVVSEFFSEDIVHGVLNLILELELILLSHLKLDSFSPFFVFVA